MQESQGRIYDTGVSGKDIGYRSVRECYRMQESQGKDIGYRSLKDIGCRSLREGYMIQESQGRI